MSNAFRKCGRYVGNIALVLLLFAWGTSEISNIAYYSGVTFGSKSRHYEASFWYVFLCHGAIVVVRPEPSQPFMTYEPERGGWAYHEPNEKQLEQALAEWRSKNPSGFRTRYEPFWLVNRQKPEKPLTEWSLSLPERLGFRMPEATTFANYVPAPNDHFVVPLWIPVALLALPWLVRKFRRRIQPGHCPHCHYNLTANTSGICPECGTPVPSNLTPAPPP